MSDMEAGPEMDARVAEKVVGWTRVRGSYAGTERWQEDAVMLSPVGAGAFRTQTATDEPVTYMGNLPRFSTDIAAAMQIADAPVFAEHHFTVSRSFTLDAEPAGWWARVANGPVQTADTAPLAICRAALATLAES